MDDEKQQFFDKLDGFFLTILSSAIIGSFITIIEDSFTLLNNLFYLLVIVHLFLNLLIFPLYFGYYRGSLLRDNFSERMVGWVLLSVGLLTWVLIGYGYLFFNYKPFGFTYLLIFVLFSFFIVVLSIPL